MATKRIDLNFVPARGEIAVSRWGDVFQLGRHQIACGTPALLRELLGDKQATTCLTDPPASLRLRVRDHSERSNGEVASGLASHNPWLLGMAYDALDVMKGVSAPGGRAYVFSEFRDTIDLHAASEILKIRFTTYRAWKPWDSVLSIPVSSSQILCCVFQTGTGPAVEVEDTLGQAGAIVHTEVDGFCDQFVPKPVELLASILESSTKEGDRVIDPFSAEGSALIAAEVTGRIFAGAEGNPFSVDTTIRRWQRATGKSAIHLHRGESFDELARQVITNGERAHV
jgi:hypothetical protein